MGRILILILVCCTTAAYAAPRAPRGEAPRNGMSGGNWSSALKEALGTSFEAYDRFNEFSAQSQTAPISKVWFTGAQGVVTEVFWPTIDTAQIKDSQILVTDGSSFFFEERVNSQTTVTWLETGVPAFKIVNRERQGRFQIERTIFTDPDRDVLYQRIRIVKNVAGLKFFILHKPNVANTPMDDSALASTGEGPGAGLYALQQGHAQALVASVGFKQASAGFAGASDGWTDIKQNFAMDWAYATASRGNVVLTAWLDIPEERGTTDLDIAIGFSADPTAARALAEQSLRIGAQPLLSKYTSQWRDYQASVKNLGGASSDGGRLFRSSVAMIKSMEDKTHEGAFVASPSHPWGQHLSDNSSNNPTAGGYHLIWPRDLYQMATAFLALDDTRSALACLSYLKSRQLTARDGDWVFGSRRSSKDGSWYQNFYVNGRHYWTGLQMDETAMPVILAYKLLERGVIRAGDYWDMVRRGADFIQRFGPWSPQERWEENMGASPSTIASEIAALAVASKFAETMGDRARAQSYADTARAWSGKPGDNIDTWTFTTSSRRGNGKHYVRVEAASSPDQTWDPNDDWMFNIANGGGRWAEKDVVDAGFLELVRFGVRAASAQTILDSIVAVDRTIRSDLPGIGPGFQRYNGDRYNYDNVTGRQTEGMPWPLLTGERGHFELGLALERRGNPDAAVAPYVAAMERMATEELMIPEQIWKAGPGVGKSTGSATPLGWAHGEYIKLLRSRSDRNIFDRMGAVRQVLGTR